MRHLAPIMSFQRRFEVIFYIEGQQFSVAEEWTRPTVDAWNNTVASRSLLKRLAREVPALHPFGVYVRSDSQGKYEVETPFRSIPVCLWWVFTTFTTVGSMPAEAMSRLLRIWRYGANYTLR